MVIMMAITNKRKKTGMKTKPTSSKLDPEPVCSKQVPRHTMKLKASCSIQSLNTSALSEHSHVGKLVHCIECVAIPKFRIYAK